ncbi:unnamed protein product [Rotaria magnacalcarata]|uniref:Phorbol-ester/DAG-type domain-containing protein n=1 Tax=Rotaria magnacalcarata TaxID=392030 RepID=A0A816WCU2_9BILA|nr:unnamed protein product [Rotaria magnacalcarata]
MLLLIILLSYILGCASTIAVLLYLYTSYAFSPPVVVNEQEDEQFETFHPLPENERAKNSAVDAVNYLFQFLFQELKDSSRLRRYLMHKLDTEFKELKNSRTGKIFVQNIIIQSFSVGKKCPIFSDIQLERQERDERNLIKEFVAKLDADYEDGFFVTLDITLLFGHKCQLSIKVKRIQGRLRLEFRREPFSHWLLVFQDEPVIDFEVKSYFATVESPQLANIITQQLRRAIKRKQTWPSYKVRFQPFFSASKNSLPADVLSANGNNLIPGSFDVLIKHCDRLSIPLTIFDKQKMSSVAVFLTVNINEKTCADYLYIDRSLWPTKELELTRNIHKIIVKEVLYMDRIELLIEQIDPIPNGIEDATAFKTALEDKNVFLLKMRGQDVKTVKQMNRLLKYKLSVSPSDGTLPTTTTTTTTANGNEDGVKIVIGMPLLHSVRVQRAAESLSVSEIEKKGGRSPTLSISRDTLTSSPNLRQRTTPSTIKSETNADSIGLSSKPSDGDDESMQTTNTEDAKSKVLTVNTTKKPKPLKNLVNDITLVMMNADILQEFQAQPTPTQKPEAHIVFNNKFEFQVGSNERYLNICLWCKPPLDCDVPNAGKKLILLGYTTVALSEIVLDAHLSYKRETQMTLNFRSACSVKPNLDISLTESESKKRVELSTHKGYDDNLAHGFVTVNVKHKPAIEARLSSQEKNEQFTANVPAFNDLYRKLKEEEIKRDQLKYINTINEQQESPARRLTDHSFDDKVFTTATVCDYCKRKIWMKTGRQCRDCQIAIHKKCEDKINAEVKCTREPIRLKTNQTTTAPDEDMKSSIMVESDISSVLAADDTDSIPIKTNYELIPSPNVNRTTTISSATSTPTTTATVAITTTTAIAAAAAATTTTTTIPVTTTAAAAVATPTTSTIVLPTTAHRLSTKAAAAFSVLDSTARRSFRAFGNRNLNSTTVSFGPNIGTTSELSKSDESINDPSNIPTAKLSIVNSPIPASSKLANAASSAYSRFREFKSKRLPAASESNPMKKAPSTTSSITNENIAEADLRDIITQCLSDESNDIKNLEHLLHERAVDDTALYAKAREFGQELFPELAPDERKQKLDGEISRLQQEMDLQCQIREEMTHEYENHLTDENEKRKLQAKIANIDEKVQALGALTILYCSGLKHCCAQLAAKINMDNELTSDLLDEDDNKGEDAPLIHPIE